MRPIAASALLGGLGAFATLLLAACSAEQDNSGPGNSAPPTEPLLDRVATSSTEDDWMTVVCDPVNATYVPIFQNATQGGMCNALTGGRLAYAAWSSTFAFKSDTASLQGCPYASTDTTSGHTFVFVAMDRCLMPSSNSGLHPLAKYGFSMGTL